MTAALALTTVIPATTTLTTQAVLHPAGTFVPPDEYKEDEHNGPRDYRIRVGDGPANDLVRGEILAAGRIDTEFLATLSPVKMGAYYKTLEVVRQTRYVDLGTPRLNVGDFTTPSVVTAVNANKDIIGHVFCIEESTDIGRWNWRSKPNDTRARYNLYTGGNSRISNNDRLKRSISFAIAQGWAKDDIQSIIWYTLGQAIPREDWTVKHILQPLEEALANNHPDTRHEVELFEYRDRIHDGQTLMSFSFRRVPQDAYITLKKKVVTGTDIAIPGVKFGIYSDAGTRNKVTEMITNEQGKAITSANSGLTVGNTYYVRELTQAEGQDPAVVPSTEVATVQVTEENGTPETAKRIRWKSGREELENTFETFKTQFTKKDVTGGNANFQNVAYKVQVVELEKNNVAIPRLPVGRFIQENGQDKVFKVGGDNILHIYSDEVHKQDILNTGTYKLVEFSVDENTNALLAPTGTYITFRNLDGVDANTVIVENNTNTQATNQQNTYLQELGTATRVTNPNNANTVWTEGVNLGLLKIVKKHAVSNQTLPNFRFRVEGTGILTNNGYVTSKEYTTGENGEVVTDPLKLGEYTVTEIGVADTFRYANPINQRINVTKANAVANAQPVEFINEQQLMDFTVKKELPVNPKGAISLAGAKFEVKVKELIYPNIQGQKQVGEVVGEYTTGEDGIIRVENLPLGSYEVKELEAPVGTLKNEGIMVVTGRYEKQGTTVPEKTSLVTYDKGTLGQAITNKVAGLQNKLNTVFNSLLPQDQIGTVNYTKEQLGLEGEASDEPNTFVNMVALGRIEISKHKDLESEIESGANPIEQGITFEITKDGEIYDTIVTNYQGKAASKYLPLGTYKVIQKNTLMVNGKPETTKVKEFDVTLNEDGQVLHYSLENTPRWMRLKVVKKDSVTGQNILQSGVKFEIYKEDTNEQITFVKYPEGVEAQTIDLSEATGEGYTLEKLKSGRYYLKEVAGPEGYFYDKDAKISFEIPSGDDETIPTITITIGRKTETVGVVDVNNEAQVGELTINKVGEKITSWEEKQATLTVFEKGTVKNIVEKENQVGVTLELEKTLDGKTTTTIVKTNDKGEYTNNTLTEGTYVLRNSKKEQLATVIVAKGKQGVISAKLPQVDVNKEIRVDGKEKQINETYYSPVYTKSTLAGAKFELVAVEDINSYDKQTKYFNKGDKLPIAQKDIVVDGNTVYKAGDVITFPVLSKEIMENKELVDYTITTKEDETKVTKMPLGKVVLREVEAPKGYVKSNEEINLTFTPQLHTIKADVKATEEIVNERQVLNVTLNKKVMERVQEFKRGNDFKGVYFAVVTKEEVAGLGVDKVVRYVTPNIEGVIEVQDLPKGNYYIKEAYTKDAYVLNDTQVDLDLTNAHQGNDKTVVTNINKTIENKAKEVEVKVVKVDVDTNERIDGVVFKLNAVTNDDVKTNVNNNVVTTKEGTILNLKEGTYELVETNAKKGYVTPKTPFVFAANEENREFVITNEKTKIEIAKVDLLTNKAVSGAKLRLVDAKGNVVKVDANWHVVYDSNIEAMDAVWVSTEETKVIRGLEAGTIYFVEELEAPKGYLNLTEKIQVNVHNEVGTQTTKVGNEEKPEIRTILTGNGAKEVNPSKEMSFTDRVYYEIKHNGPFKEKEMFFRLMDKETKKVFLDAQGKEVSKKVKFTPTARKGYVDITVTFDGSHINKDLDLVAFEDMSRNGIILTSEHNFENESQTVKVKKLKVGTTVKVEGNKTYVQGTYKFKDTVGYEGLAKGETEFVGYLANAITKELLKDANGNVYKGVTIVNITEENGEVDVEFTIDTDLHPGVKVVVLEEVNSIGTRINEKTGKEEKTRRLVGEHKNYKDPKQTFEILKPRMNTTATIGGKKVIEAKGIQEMEDVIDYENYAPNNWYEFETSYYDHSTKDFLKDDNGNILVFRTEKFITTPNGSVVVKYPLDTDKYAGRELTVYEKANRITKDKDGKVIEKRKIDEHSDKTSKSQTFTIKKKPSRIPNTAQGGLDAYFLGVITLLVGSLFLISKKGKEVH